MSQAELRIEIDELAREGELRERDYVRGRISFEAFRRGHEESKQKLIDLRLRVIAERDGAELNRELSDHLRRKDARSG